MKRALFVFAAALFLILGSGAAASATPSPDGLVAAWCKPLPTAEAAGSSPLDWIDPGPSEPAAGIYSSLGYSGWDVFSYDPGCMERVKAAIGNQLLPNTWQYEPLKDRLGITAESESDAVKLANALIQAQLAMIAVTAAAVRIATGTHPVWDAFDPVETTLRTVIGPQVMLLWLGVAVVATGLYVVHRASSWRNETTHRVVTTSTAIVFVAAGLSLWNGTVGVTWGKMIDESYKASSEVTVGSSSQEAHVDAGTMTADVMIEHLVLPAWGAAHMGWDMNVVAEYAPRLREARSLTKQQTAATDGDKAARDQSLKTLENQTRQALTQLETAYPASYEQLSSRSYWRALYPAVSGFTILLSFIVIGFLLAWIIAGRVIGPLSVALAPLLAPAMQIPAYQRYAIGLVAFVWWLAKGTVLATVALLVYVRVGVAMVMAAEGIPWGYRVISSLALASALILAWKFRKQWADKFGITERVDQATKMRDAVRDGVKEGWASVRGTETSERATESTSTGPGPSAVPASGGQVNDTATASVRAATSTPRKVDPEQQELRRNERAVQEKAEAETAARPAAHMRPVKRRVTPKGIDATEAFQSSTNPAIRQMEKREAAEIARRVATPLSTRPVKKAAVATVTTAKVAATPAPARAAHAVRAAALVKPIRKAVKK